MKPSQAQALKQEQEAFALNQRHQADWFRLRLIMAYTSLIATLLIAGVLAYIVFHADRFSLATVTAATGGLVFDLLAAGVSMWKLVVSSAMAPLAPTSTRR